MGKKLSKKRLLELLQEGVIYEPKPMVFKSLDHFNIEVKTEADVKRVIKKQRQHQREIAKYRDWS